MPTTTTYRSVAPPPPDPRIIAHTKFLQTICDNVLTPTFQAVGPVLRQYREYITSSPAGTPYFDFAYFALGVDNQGRMTAWVDKRVPAADKPTHALVMSYLESAGFQILILDASSSSPQDVIQELGVAALCNSNLFSCTASECRANGTYILAQGKNGRERYSLENIGSLCVKGLQGDVHLDILNNSYYSYSAAPHELAAMALEFAGPGSATPVIYEF